MVWFYQGQTDGTTPMVRPQQFLGKYVVRISFRANIWSDRVCRSEKHWNHVIGTIQKPASGGIVPLVRLHIF